ncbi:MFS-type transporter SLC18B1-like [Saccostrea cucullata]|uniref:MFS-type transporter SLC18B1-like n=1 Tax=Saccostrea cuccullata TaxID=36930 RepID=UPI002ED0FB6D
MTSADKDGGLNLQYGTYQQVGTSDDCHPLGNLSTAATPGWEGEECDRQILSSEYSEYRDEAGSSNPRPFSLCEISRDKKVLLLMMAVCNFCAAANFSILGPFFPEEANKKGTSQTVVGLIFGIFELISFLVSPIFGNYMTKIGTKFLFVAGVSVSGVCTILFGVLIYSPGGYQFILLSFLCRSLEALASAAFITASYAILTDAFPKHIATVVGYLELFTGVGMMVGPAIGGGLYSLSGYGLPFYVLGGSLTAAGAISFFFLPTLDSAHRTLSVSVLQLLKSSFVWCVAGCIVSGSYTISYMEATLANHLHKLGIGTVPVSLMFLIPPALYGITSPIWGWISDSKNYVVSLVVSGALLASIFFFTLGPSPIFPFLPFSLWLVSVSLAGVGIFLSCLMIPSFTAILVGAERLGMEDNLETFGIVSGLFNSCYSFGAFIGPISGSALVDAAGFGWGSTVCAGLLILSGLVLLVFVTVNRNKFGKVKTLLPTQRKFSFRRGRGSADTEMSSGFVDKEETEMCSL